MKLRKNPDLSRAINSSENPVKVILWLSWPVLIEQFMTSLVSYADTAMVGALGSYATASVTISNSPNFLINGAIMALGTGVTTMVAMSVGSGDNDKARKIVRQALLILATLGMFLWGTTLLLHRAIPVWMGAGEDIIDFAASYNLIFGLGRIFSMTTIIISSALRGCGDTQTPMTINLLVNIINVVGNFLLIQPTRQLSLLGREITVWGAGFGVNGAAAASAVSMAVGGILMLFILFKRPSAIQVSMKDSFKVEWPLMRQIVTISLPALFERLCTSGSGIIINASIAQLGTDFISANSLQLTAESISYMPAFAFATAATTLMGQSLGAGKPELGRKYMWTTVKISVAIMCFMGAALYFTSELILGLFTPDEHVIEIGTKCLHIVSFIQPVQVFTWVVSGALRGAGDTKWTFYITAITTWGVRVLCSVLCLKVFHLSLPSTIVCACAENAVRGFLMWLRFRSGKWEKTSLLSRI